jgi:hypothetical protein
MAKDPASYWEEADPELSHNMSTEVRAWSAQWDPRAVAIVKVDSGYGASQSTSDAIYLAFDDEFLKENFQRSPAFSKHSQSWQESSQGAYLKRFREHTATASTTLSSHVQEFIRPLFVSFANPGSGTKFSESTSGLFYHRPDRNQLSGEVRTLLRTATSEGFEHLAEGLALQVSRYGSEYVEAISDLYQAKECAETDLAELLAFLGEVDDDLTAEARRQLLVRALGDESSAIRYGAIMGLANVRNTTTDAALATALSKEVDPLLLKLMRRALGLGSESGSAKT